MAGKVLEQLKKVSWDSVKQEALTPMISRRFLSANGATLARFELKQGAVVPQHEHPNGQLTWVVEGALRFKSPGQEDVVVRTGEVLIIPPHLPHAAYADADCTVVDTFIPEREDWAAGNDAYLRGK
jgi:unsaturated pyranuronate lyase